MLKWSLSSWTEQFAYRRTHARGQDLYPGSGGTRAPGEGTFPIMARILLVLIYFRVYQVHTVKITLSVYVYQGGARTEPF